MVERQWYPYAPDQQFGVRAAADADALDRLVAMMESRRPEPPRPGNKAPLAGKSHVPLKAAPIATPASWRAVAEWLAGSAGPTRGAAGNPPSTVAAALDASPWVRTDG